MLPVPGARIDKFFVRHNSQLLATPYFLRGKSGQLPEVAIVIFNIWGFLLGIAAPSGSMRLSDRVMVQGRRPQSALGWLLGRLRCFSRILATFGNYPLGLFPTRLIVISSIVALIEIVVGTLVGAWLYKEDVVISQTVRPATA